MNQGNFEVTTQVGTVFYLHSVCVQYTRTSTHGQDTVSLLSTMHKNAVKDQTMSNLFIRSLELVNYLFRANVNAHVGLYPDKS